MGDNDIISYREIKKVDVQNEFCRIYIGKSLGPEVSLSEVVRN